jgi:hypothetical protein
MGQMARGMGEMQVQNWARMLNLVAVKVAFKVVKTDVMRPFYIGCHVSVCFDAYVVFVKMKEGKSLVILKLPSLQLVIENGFRLQFL